MKVAAGAKELRVLLLLGDLEIVGAAVIREDQGFFLSRNRSNFSKAAGETSACRQ